MSRQPTRWERVLEQKPRPASEQLLEEVARLFAAELRRWPPEVEALGLVAPVLGARPDERVFAEAFRLARWDLARDTAASDDYFRNARFLALGLAAEARPQLLFVSRWLVEMLLSLSESTEGRVDRRQMPLLLDRIHACYLDPP